ncbi:MAG TPA: metalloregulator ArsR/SmtB family transcription factor [candidate division Zixibacteria bacterium]
MDNRCALIFQALSDHTRQKILTLLTKEEMCVTEIGRHFQMTQPSISHHLDILKRAGLVVFQKKGKEVFYRANCCVCVPGCCQDFLGKLGLVIKCKKA